MFVSPKSQRPIAEDQKPIQSPSIRPCTGLRLCNLSLGRSMPTEETLSTTAAESTVRRRRQALSRPQNLDAGVNPVIQTYLLSGEHGTFRRYLLELCLVLGLFLPWLGPLLGLCGIIPLIELDILETAVITPSSYCFAQAANGTVCNGTAVYEYYFWNLTNTEQVCS